MKVIIYRGNVVLYAGDPLHLSEFFKNSLPPEELKADRVEIQALGDRSYSISYKKFLDFRPTGKPKIIQT